MSMTLNEFIARLEQTPREWTLRRNPLNEKLTQWITCGEHCPLSFVANSQPLRVSHAALALNMNLELANRIASAADGERGLSPLRERLLKACGLHA